IPEVRFDACHEQLHCRVIDTRADLHSPRSSHTQGLDLNILSLPLQKVPLHNPHLTLYSILLVEAIERIGYDEKDKEEEYLSDFHLKTHNDRAVQDQVHQYHPSVQILTYWQ